MYQEVAKDDQLEATLKLAAKLRSLEASRTFEASAPLRVGDTFVSRRTAAYAVEWLLLETAEEDGRVRVVALDQHPFVGSRDYLLLKRSPADTTVLRLDFNAWVAASELEPELRTGGLRASQVAGAQLRCRELEEGELEASLLEEEVDGDPEYRYWRGWVLQPALSALTGVDESIGVEAPERVVLKASRFRRWRPVLLAALVLLMVTVPLIWQVQRLSRQLEGEQARITEMARSRETLMGQLADSQGEVGRLASAMEELRKATERTLTEQRKQVKKRLRRALTVGAVVNVPSFVLAQAAREEARRGSVEVIDLRRAPRFTLSLEVPDPEPYLEYRLRVVEKIGGREAWATDGLVKVNGKWLRLDLPFSLFEPVGYELEIYGLGLGRPNLLTERYAVKFVNTH